MVEVRQVIWDGKPTQYFLFSNGDLYNINTHRSAMGTKSNGYLRYTLNIEGQTISVAQHRLLAEYFIENDDPINKTVVHHINGCTQDNRLENLEWVSQQENCIKKINPIESKITEILTDEELEKEIWVPLLGNSKTYMVSNMGRIKNLNTNKITFGSRNKNNGYIRWTYSDNDGFRKEIQAHRAVYQSFHLDEELQVINHIDSNRGNNRLENLENISQSENVIKSYHSTKTKKTRLTGQYNENMELINVFASTSDAGRFLGLASCSNLSRAMKTGKQSHGFYWREISEEEYNNFKNKK